MRRSSPARCRRFIIDGRLHQHARHGPTPASFPTRPMSVVVRRRAESALLFDPQHRRALYARRTNCYAPTGTWSFPAGTVSSRPLNCKPTRAIPPLSSAWKPACWCGTPTAPSMVSLTNGGRLQRRRFALYQFDRSHPHSHTGGVITQCGITPVPAIAYSATRRWPIMSLASTPVS